MRVLKAIGSISVLTATFVSAGPALAGEISGKQYVVLGGGSRTLSDNEIRYFPCASVNGSCKEDKKAIDAIISDAKSRTERAELRSDEICGYKTACTPAIDHFDVYSDFWLKSTEKTNQILSALKNPSSTRTDFEGNFLFECPTQNCLVYSTGMAGRTSSQWIDVLPAGSKTDLSGSRAYTVNLPNGL